MSSLDHESGIDVQPQLRPGPSIRDWIAETRTQCWSVRRCPRRWCRCNCVARRVRTVDVDPPRLPGWTNGRRGTGRCRRSRCDRCPLKPSETVEPVSSKTPKPCVANTRYHHRKACPRVWPALTVQSKAASSRPALVEAPEPDATCCLVGPSDLVASRRPVDLGVLGGGSIPGNLAHLVCRPVLPHDIDVGVARDFLGQPAANLLCLR